MSEQQPIEFRAPPGRTIDLEFTGNRVLALPDRPISNQSESTRGRRYWTSYNEAEHAYRSGDFEHSAKVLAKLWSSGEMHETGATLYLRSLRKWRDGLHRVGKLKAAWDVSKEMLDDSRLPTTAFDDRAHNRIAALLGAPAHSVDVRAGGSSRRRTSVELRLSCSHWVVSDRFLKDTSDKTKSQWAHRLISKAGTMELSRVWSDDQGAWRMLLRVHDLQGLAAPIVQLDHAPYRIGWNPNASTFATLCRDDLTLRVHHVSGELIRSVALGSDVRDEHHLRAVATSPFGDLFTSAERVFVLPSTGNGWSARTPPKDGWERRVRKPIDDIPPDHRRAADILGVDPSAAPREVATAYKIQARRHHPDLNPHDDMATARMQGINWAYEFLTGESPLAILQEVDETYKLVSRSRIDIPGVGSIQIEFGLSNMGDDWIYAAAMNPADGRVYLGCYSGRVFELSLEGEVRALVDARLTVDELTPLSDSLLLKTATRIFSVVNGALVGEVDVWRKPITYHSTGFILQDRSRLELYDSRCHEIGTIETSENPRGYWRADNALVVEFKNESTVIRGIFD